ncbi:MAG: dihydropteroate synthase [Dehalococcoidia bacterium]|nr:dihydropteroate synthase [Dehalococcoidia bacterium]
MILKLRDRQIDVTNRTAVMGILNVSDDSPIAFSRVGVEQARERAHELVAQGAAIIDVGAHSTATGARDLNATEEIERVVPVIEALAQDGLITSVDTWTPEVARAAAEAGVHLLNDVTGFVDDGMVAVAREFEIPGCIMHMRGDPKHHREVSQQYEDIEAEVRTDLVRRAQILKTQGVDVWLDPGFGFGRSAADNAALLRGVPALVEEGYPVLISASRKGFLAELMGESYGQQRDGLLEATIAFNSLAAYWGAHVVRVHDVAEVSDAVRVASAIRSGMAGVR